MHGGYSSKASGTGLGLSICRHLAGTHGATFALESAVAKGTTVRLEAPGHVVVQALRPARFHLVRWPADLAPRPPEHALTMLHGLAPAALDRFR